MNAINLVRIKYKYVQWSNVVQDILQSSVNKDQITSADSFAPVGQQRGRFHVKGVASMTRAASASQRLGALSTIVPDQLYTGLEIVCEAMMREIYNDIVLQVNAAAQVSVQVSSE